MAKDKKQIEKDSRYEKSLRHTKSAGNAGITTRDAAASTLTLGELCGYCKCRLAATTCTMSRCSVSGLYRHPDGKYRAGNPVKTEPKAVVKSAPKATPTPEILHGWTVIRNVDVVKCPGCQMYLPIKAVTEGDDRLYFDCSACGDSAAAVIAVIANSDDTDVDTSAALSAPSTSTKLPD